MAIVIGAGIAAIGTVAGSAISSSGAKSAANTQANAANAANQTQLQMFNTIQANEAPWVTTGQQANSALGAFYGLPGASGSTASGASSPDYSKILSNLPGYQFQLQQGTQATQRDLAAQGLLQSGAAGKALTTFGQGLAQNYAGQYTAGLTNLSQLGEAGAAGVGSAGINAANQIGSNQIYAGNAAAAGAVNSASAFNQGISGLSGLAGLWGSQPQGISPYSGSITAGAQNLANNVQLPAIQPLTDQQLGLN